MAVWDEDRADARPSTLDEVQRICKMRLDELGAQMAELEAVAKRAAGERNALVMEMRQIEGVLDATKQTEPEREIATVGFRD